jgi:hypothetical protein
MHYETAERVCAAVVAFARDGSGRIEPVYWDANPRDPTFFCIHARDGFALVQIVASEKLLRVLGLQSNHPLHPVAKLL